MRINVCGKHVQCTEVLGGRIIKQCCWYGSAHKSVAAILILSWASTIPVQFSCWPGMFQKFHKAFLCHTEGIKPVHRHTTTSPCHCWNGEIGELCSPILVMIAPCHFSENSSQVIFMCIAHNNFSKKWFASLMNISYTYFAQVVNGQFSGGEKSIKPIHSNKNFKEIGCNNNFNKLVYNFNKFILKSGWTWVPICRPACKVWI